MIQNKRELRTLKMQIKLFKAVEKKRKKEKVFKSFHEMAIGLLNQFLSK